MRKLSRLGVAIGGFLIATSILLIGLILLVLSNFVDISIFADETNILLLMLILLFIGILDFVASVILLRR